jgi:hypothetical protein
VQPADGQQVREPAAAHCLGIVFVDRILVACGESDRDSRGSFGEP